MFRITACKATHHRLFFQTIVGLLTLVKKSYLFSNWLCAGSVEEWSNSFNINCIGQGCQTLGLLGATLHVGNRAEGRMVFSIWRLPLLREKVSVM